MSRAKPFLKWAGGKTQILKYIHKIIRNLDLSKISYYEPFVGGGSMFFSNNYRRAVINDLNQELINAYVQVRDNVDELISSLEEHQAKHAIAPRDHYYEVRSWDRFDDFNHLPDVEKAARVIYLNKTCYNGLYRVNSKGEFNTPIGRYTKPKILDEENLRKVSKILQKKKNIIKSTDFEQVVKYAKKGSLIYFDPPYDYDGNNGFVEYVKDGFGEAELTRLRDLSLKLIERGCYVIISNHDTVRVRRLFGATDKFKYTVLDETAKPEFITEYVNANRSINANASRRKQKVREVIIYGSNLPASG